MIKADDNDSWIRVIHPTIQPPTLKDNTADVDRLLKGIKKALQTEEVTMDFSLVKRVPYILRKYEYDVRPVLYRWRDSWYLIDLFPPNIDDRIYGISVDLGTSTVVVRLLDLINKETKDESSFQNPQIKMGTDILTRIHAASQEGGLDRLQHLIIDRINEEIDHLSKRNDINKKAITGMSVAGNTTMEHLFLGLNPYWICREPYIPVINRPDLITSSNLGIKIHPESPVMVMPNVGSYFGGDLMAGILASGMHHQKETSILVDVGTNAEVVLGNRDWLMACAGAAGPALEGGVAAMGMMAGPGVIDKVIIESSSREFQIRTIENKPPVGICGSGMIDLLAQLFLAGMIDLQGKFVVNRCGERLRDIDGIQHLEVIASKDSATGEALTLSQTDIDALLRSKAAMFAILTTITRMINVSFHEISHFYIAGTFGSYVDPRSAITVGMIPDLPLETYKPLGNTSLMGASMALLFASARDDVYQIRDRITYIELNVNQEFMNLFSAAKFIPHTNRSLFPSVREWVSE